MENIKPNVQSVIRKSTADMVTVDIKDRTVDERLVEPEGKKSFRIFEQRAFVSFDGEYRKIILSVRDRMSGFETGTYEIDFGKSVEINKFGQFELKRNLHLTKV